MSTSIDLESINFDDGDYELLDGIMKTLERAREDLKKAKEISLPTRGNSSLFPLDITLFRCTKEKEKIESLMDDDDSDKEAIKDESLNNKEEAEVKYEEPQDGGNSGQTLKGDQEVSFLCLLLKHVPILISRNLNGCAELLHEEDDKEKEQLWPKEHILVKIA